MTEQGETVAANYSNPACRGDTSAAVVVLGVDAMIARWQPAQVVAGEGGVGVVGRDRLALLVILKRPSIERGACARMARFVGPPPRPMARLDREEGQLDTVAASHVGQARLAR